MLPGLLKTELQRSPGTAAHVHPSLHLHLAGLMRPLTSLLYRFRWDSGSGATADSNDLVSKESKRVAYEIKQTLGIKGFVINLTGSPSLAAGLPFCWDAVRPCLETPALEDAAAQIASEASRLAEELGAPRHKALLRLSHDQAAQLQAGLDFYHFLLPTMLVLSSALRQACDQALARRGIVDRPPPEKAVREDGLQGLFERIREIVSLAPEHGSAARPRSWSIYVAAASAQLRPLLHGENYHRAAARLQKISAQLTPGFQPAMGAVELDGLAAIARQVTRLETLLPSLIMSITLLELYLRPAESRLPAHALLVSPAPAARPDPKTQRSPALPPVVELPAGLLAPA